MGETSAHSGAGLKIIPLLDRTRNSARKETVNYDNLHQEYVTGHNGWSRWTNYIAMCISIATMRPPRARSKVLWASTAVFICVIIFIKRKGINKFYEDNFSVTLNSADGATYRPSNWPPQLRIVKKTFAVSTNSSAPTPSPSSGPAVQKERKTVLSSQQACRLPQLRLDDQEMAHLFFDPKPLRCAKDKNWVYVRNGTFYIDPDAVARHGAIACNYMNFWRESDYYTGSKVETNFSNGTKLRGDFFKVDCRSSNDGASYSNVHAAIVPPAGAIERCRSKQLPQTALGLNVYILGFDSVSRMHFMRKLPKTYKYLTETMNAIVLKGYNIVGDGTPQALIPVLTGKTEEELPLTRKRFRNAHYVNVYPFVWNEFRNAGYATLYGEDASNIGTFTYRLKGFDEQPTDHYMRTFYSVAEGEAKRHSRHCWGSEPHHKVHFRYVEDFWKSYPSDIRKFAFQFHSIYSHGDLNQVAVADEDMVRHLRFFVQNGYMNNTILIFMSDHGPRFTKSRETQQGKLEERLPFFSFSFPPWFVDKYPEAVKAFQSNADRLTTPFDIHATLQSILNFNPEPRVGNLKQREMSLFDFVPPERTCSDAGVAPHWCSCLQWAEASISDPMVVYAANGLVHTINLETERERRSCAVLKLHSVTKASMYAPPSAVLQYKDARDKDGFVPDMSDNTPVSVIYYQIHLRTTPGDAHYEASMAYDTQRNELIIDLDTVSHVNKYGDLPHCVIDRDYFLAKWCVCLDKVKSR